MCNKRFDSSVIELHAEPCDGPESDSERQWNEAITRYTSTTAVTTITSSKSGTAASPSVGGRKGGLSVGERRGKRGRGRGKSSYQPSIKQLVNKEKEVTGEEEIDSSTPTGEFAIGVYFSL